MPITNKLTAIELIHVLKQTIDQTPARSHPALFAKSFLMAYLVTNYDLKNYVQIGSDPSNVFFHVAQFLRLTGGLAYRVNSDQVNDSRGPKNESFEKDTSKDHQEVIEDQQLSDFGSNSWVTHENEITTIESLLQNKVAIDILHISDNSGALIPEKDLRKYLSLLKEGTFVVVDNIHADDVRPVYNQLRKSCSTVFSNGIYAILSKDGGQKGLTPLEKRRLDILHNMAENLEQDWHTFEPDNISNKSTKISVLVISYNHEKYISQCLEGILAQKGDFEIELVIGDDFSSDGTLSVIQSYANYATDNKRFSIKILPTDHNHGMVRNLKRCLAECSGEYFAICEGDDFWIDANKLQKQLNFLKMHPECAICFNDIYFYYQETNTLEEEKRPKVDIISTRDIILDNSMGNFSRFFYDAKHLKKVPEGLFDLEIADWMFNICYSQFGDIGSIKDVMSVYRIHQAGIWSGQSDSEKINRLYSTINEYNKFMKYEYDREFSEYQRRLETSHLFERKFTTTVVERAERKDQIQSRSTWKNRLSLHQIRIWLAPHNSRRAKILRYFYYQHFLPFKNFVKNIRARRELRLIEASDLFDRAWYLETYPDINPVTMNAALHYLRYGGFEGRDPGPNFSSSGYLHAYEDVKRAGINPLIHYLRYGKKEGRTSIQPQEQEATPSIYRCPVCGERVNKFVALSSYYEDNFEKYNSSFRMDDFETINPEQYQCPHCGATDRDRLYALYLGKILSNCSSAEPITLLDIAPSETLKKFLLKHLNIKYQSADKYMGGVDLVIDITDMSPIENGRYDFFICSHVLEHVSDDNKALAELYRVLKPGGQGILMVPINLRITEIDEDPNVTDTGERWRRFAQDDHIRLYSKDGFIKRVEEAGFLINQFGISYFGEDTFSHYGISPKSILYVVTKK